MKKIRYIFIGAVILVFYSIFLSSFVRNIYLSSNSEGRLSMLRTPVRYMAELPSLLKKSLEEPEFMVANKNLENGLNVIVPGSTSSYPKLLYSYKDEQFGQKFELFDLRKNESIKLWKPDNKKLFDLGYNEKNPRRPPEGSDLHFIHPFMQADSSLIFNSQITSLLAKIDSESNIIWTKNDRRYHHTTELDHEGNLYVCTQPFEAGRYDILPGEYEKYKSSLIDDEIVKINPDNGEILFQKSIIEILVENGYENILLGKGQFISDMIHLNDIQPALSDSEFWKKGDLLISCRNICTIFLYRPSTNKVIWLKNGPWYNQHDADFLGKDKIVIFGNDILREESTLDPKVTPKNLFFNEKRTNNEVYLYDFTKDTVTTPYSELMKLEEVRTVTSGRCDVLPNGDIFIEETNNGRIIFGDSLRKKSEFVKRVDSEHISSMFWSRLIN